MDSKLGHSFDQAAPRSVGTSDRPGLASGVRIGAGVRHAGQGWAAWLPAAARRQVWSGLLATTAMLALLLAIHQVVLGGVRQGESRRQAAAVLADATWRCKALRGTDLALNCLAGLAGPMAQPALGWGVPERPAVLPRLLALSDGASTRLAPQSSPASIRPATPRGPPESTE